MIRWLCSNFLKRCESRSACATRARLLLRILPETVYVSENFFLTHTWARRCWDMLPDKIRNAIVEQILDDDDDHMLSQHMCSVLALETVYEAQTMLYESCVYDTRSQNKGIWLWIISSILRNAPYTVKCDKEHLEWILPKYKGHGMQCLKILHQRSVNAGKNRK